MMFQPKKKDDDGPDRGFLTPLTFDCLLNCLDGVERSDGIFTIVTTNANNWSQEILPDLKRAYQNRFSDELIAATLNRLGLRTGEGNTWNKQRVYTSRHYQELPAFDPNQPQPKVTLEEAAERLQVSPASIRRLIAEKKLLASQVVESAPWEIPVEALDSELVRKAISEIKSRVRSPRTPKVDGQETMFSDS